MYMLHGCADTPLGCAAQLTVQAAKHRHAVPLAAMDAAALQPRPRALHAHANTAAAAHVTVQQGQATALLVPCGG
jgi:hypothetical protein